MGRGTRWKGTAGDHKGPPMRIKLRMAGVSRRGEGGWDVDGRALVAARRSPLLGLDVAVPNPRAATRAPTPPNSSPAPTRDPSQCRFLFWLLLRLMRLLADKSA